MSLFSVSSALGDIFIAPSTFFYLLILIMLFGGFLAGIVVNNLPANVRDARSADSIPGPRRSPGEGNGNPLQYSCLENSVL